MEAGDSVNSRTVIRFIFYLEATSILKTVSQFADYVIFLLSCEVSLRRVLDQNNFFEKKKIINLV